MTDLDQRIELHRKWLLNEPGGIRLNASHEDLAVKGVVVGISKGKLYGANLSKALLRGVNLRNADLRNTNLLGAVLTRARLGGANLCSSDLSYSHLEGAELSGADLSHTDLHQSFMGGADLTEADLSCANFTNACTSKANLSNTDLTGIRGIWQDHNLLSEILWRAADTVERQMLASFVGRKTNWCWTEWTEWKHPEKDWAFAQLAKWVHYDDTENDIPIMVWEARWEARKR